MNPFPSTSSKSGQGHIRVSLLPPGKPVLETLSYQYPLKLIAPPAIWVRVDEKEKKELVHTVFLLSYGGGLVGGDVIELGVDLADSTRLVLLTQGSTKIFKSPSPQIVTRQTTRIRLEAGSALCWLPDPVQPFADSCFAQTQRYELHEGANLCVLDWVCEGRRARDESWDFWSYGSCNEVWLAQGDAPMRLMLRDNLILDARQAETRQAFGAKMHGTSAFGTLIVGGPMLGKLADYFVTEFKALPRIGNKQWDAPAPQTEQEAKRARRVAQEGKDGVLWTAANVRSFVVVKFGAAEPEGGKRWLLSMLVSEGSIEREFGAGSLLCLG